MEGPKLSVIIVTKDRRNELLVCVRSVITSLDICDEVIIVDGSKTPLGADQIPPRVRYFHLPSKNRCEARNFGIEVARNEIIAFLDSDGYVHRDWLSFLLEAYREHPEAGGVGGSVIQESLRAFGPRGGRVTPWGMIYGDFIGGEEVVHCDHLFGANMSFRRDVLLKVGGFDRNYTGTAFREETDIAVRIRRLGYKLFYQPGAVFYHEESKQGRAIVERLHQARSLVLNHTYFYFKNYLTVYPVLILLLPLFFLDISIMLLKVKRYYRDPLGFFYGWLGFIDGLMHYKPLAEGQNMSRTTHPNKHDTQRATVCHSLLTRGRKESESWSYILDIGSGSRPRLDATHLSDLYADDNSQRGGLPLKTEGKPFVRCAVEFLPFRDNAFIMNYACQILEHVDNPAIALSEIIRVAKCGYIETPTKLAEKIYGWNFHKWVCYFKAGQIHYKRKGRSQSLVNMHSLWSRNLAVCLLDHALDCLFGWHNLRVLWRKTNQKVVFKRIIFRNLYKYSFLRRMNKPVDFQFLSTYFRNKIAFLEID